MSYPIVCIGVSQLSDLARQKLCTDLILWSSLSKWQIVGQWNKDKLEAFGTSLCVKYSENVCSHPEYTCFAGSGVQMCECCVSTGQTSCSENKTITTIKRHYQSCSPANGDAVACGGQFRALPNLLQDVCGWEEEKYAPRWWGTAVPSVTPISLNLTGSWC